MAHDKEQTAFHLFEEIGNILVEHELTPIDVAKQLEKVYGKKIHKAIDGFIQFSKDNPTKLASGANIMVLLHDINGAMNEDKELHPKVTEYAKYSVVKKKASTAKGKSKEVVINIRLNGKAHLMELLDFVSDKLLEDIEMDIKDANKDDVFSLLDETFDKNDEFAFEIGRKGFAIIEDNIEYVLTYMQFKDKHKANEVIELHV